MIYNILYLVRFLALVFSLCSSSISLSSESSLYSALVARARLLRTVVVGFGLASSSLSSLSSWD